MLAVEPAMWLAVQVAPQHEQSVAAQLKRKGEEQFLPTVSTRRRWSDRNVTVDKPLFPGYVFCRTNKSSIRVILDTSGVYRIVSFGGRLCPIPDEEINSLQLAV